MASGRGRASGIAATYRSLVAYPPPWEDNVHRASVEEGPGVQQHFEYFVLRIARSLDESSPPLRGIVERLGTQQKHDFENGSQLLELLGQHTRGVERSER